MKRVFEILFTGLAKPSRVLAGPAPAIHAGMQGTHWIRFRTRGAALAGIGFLPCSPADDAAAARRSRPAQGRA